MEIISVVNQKGGTGKTTTALNLGVALASNHKRVLLLDLDPQGNMTYSLGLEDSINCSSDFFYKDKEFKDLIVTTNENVDIVGSGIELANVEINISNEEDREFLLTKAFRHIDYDFIIIDCAPTLSLLTVNALVASTKVLIPLQMTVLSVKGLELIIDTVTQINEVLNDQLSIIGVLPVRVNNRVKLTSEIREYISSNYDVNVLDVEIRENVKVMEAPSFGQSVIKYAPKCNSSIDYLELANKILKST